MTHYHHRGFTIAVERFSPKQIEYSVWRDSDGMLIAGGQDRSTMRAMRDYWMEEIDELLATNGASMDMEAYFTPTIIDAVA